MLESLVFPVTRGDPESPLRWTSKSTRKLATELTAQGYAVGPAVLPHHRELAGASAHRSRDHRAAHWHCAHGERLDGEGEARYADLSTWRQSPER